MSLSYCCTDSLTAVRMVECDARRARQTGAPTSPITGCDLLYNDPLVGPMD